MSHRTPHQPVCLDTDACRVRQHRLLTQAQHLGVQTVLLTDRRHVHYLTGYWHFSPNTATAVILPSDGPVTLIAPQMVSGAVDDCQTYQASRLSTLVDDQWGALLAVAAPLLTGRIGADAVHAPWHLPDAAVDLKPVLHALRRTKDDDEIAMIQRAVDCCDAAYASAKRVLQPGLDEVHLYTQLQAAATEAAGEPIGDFGNDFQAGTAGGLPRRRAVESGEIAIYDLTVIYRGYCCDLCRSFAVGGTPSRAQETALRLLRDAFACIEESVKPGVSCRAVYDRVHRLLDGRYGWRFPHHLGHGVGLSPHEAPHLNPHWDDTFQPGDVFTAEPGLYGDDLRGGLRIENDYLVTEDGVRQLNRFPTDLA